MTDEQFTLIKRLAKCRFLPGSFEKRFVRDMAGKPQEYELSERQAYVLKALRYTYRRQLGEPNLRDDFSPLAKLEAMAERDRLDAWNSGQARNRTKAARP